jgi:transcriptional regulator with XRE-family HTH domain
MAAVAFETQDWSMSMMHPQVGTLLRDWRQRRRMSQLDLALEAEISARHLSFVETGRSRPSREMVTRLARQLEVPPREQNALLIAAGYAPVYPERSLDDPELAAVREAVDMILKGHEPVPALVIDRGWNLKSANRSATVLLAGAAPALLEPPVNVIRLALHPEGAAPRIRNLPELRENLITRLEREIAITGAPELIALVDEVRAYPVAERSRTERSRPAPIARSVAIPLELEVGDDALAFYSATTVFGTPVDITLSELAIESFFPADANTAAWLRRQADAADGTS